MRCVYVLPVCEILVKWHQLKIAYSKTKIFSPLFFFHFPGYVSSQTSQKAVLRSEKLSEIKAPLPAKPSSKNSAKEDIHESTRVSPTLPAESQKKQKQQHCSGLVVTDCKYFPVPTEFDKKISEWNNDCTGHFILENQVFQNLSIWSFKKVSS